MHVLVRLGTEAYALPVENVREVVELCELTRLPGAGEAVLGVINLRGSVLPVFDLARLVGAGDAEPDRSRLVVAEDGDRFAGLAVDDVTDVAELPGELGEADGELLAGSVLMADRLIGALAVDRLFDRLQRGGGAA